MRLVVLAVLITLSVGCGSGSRPPTPTPAVGIAPGWAYAGKARVTRGEHAMVVSGSGLASHVGRDILRQGGNAADAAVAVGFALAVVHPEAGNLGGGGFMVIRLRDGTVNTLDYRETAPARATRDMYLDAQGEPTDRSVTGHLAAGVPGAVAGLVEAHRRYGRLPFGRVIEPAIRLARDGFVVDDYRSESIRGDSARLAAFPASRASFLPDGAPPAPGTLLRQPDLAATLEAIRDRGADGFYRGRVADLIVARDGPGRRPDLACRISRATMRSGESRSSSSIGATRFTPCHPPRPAASRWARSSTSWKDTDRCRRSARPRCCTARRKRCGARSPIATPTWATRPSCATRPTACSPRPTRRSSAGPSASSLRPRPAFAPSRRTGASTTHYSVVDAEGNAVSCTTTLNNSYGSAVTVDRRGLPAQRRDGRLRHRAGQAEHVRTGARGGERDRPGEADALGDDAEHRARSRGSAAAGRRDPRRSQDHHHGVSRDLERDRPPDVVARRGRGAPDASSGTAGHAHGRARRLSGRDARQPDAPAATRSARPAIGGTSRRSSARPRGGRG